MAGRVTSKGWGVVQDREIRLKVKSFILVKTCCFLNSNSLYSKHKQIKHISKVISNRFSVLIKFQFNSIHFIY